MESGSNNSALKILIALLVIVVILAGVKYFIDLGKLQDSQSYLNSLSLVLNDVDSQTASLPVIKTSDPRLGSGQADNIIFFFGDFECPFCKQLADSLRELYNDYSDRLLIVWKDLPNPSHPNSQSAAIAARCAQNQDKFWEYHQQLYDNQANLNRDIYLQIGQNLDLDIGKFERCLDNQETLVYVEDGFQEGLNLKVDGTPYLFFNGQRIDQAVDAKTLEKLIK